MKNIISYQLQMASVEVFKEHQTALTNKIGNKGGIYILYKGKKLYYIGKAAKLKSRIKKHFKDHHSAKWDYFSIYVVEQEKYIKELEKLLISLLKPQGNKLLYEKELKKSRKELLSEIKKLQGEQLKSLFHLECGIYKKQKPASKSSKSKKKVKRNKPLICKYKGKKYTAFLLSNGTIRYKNKIYQSATAAAKQIINRKTGTVNGLKFWKLEDKNSKKLLTLKQFQQK